MRHVRLPWLLRLLAPPLLAILPLQATPVAPWTQAPEANRYGVNHDFLLTSQTALERTREAGFGWIHYILYWNYANPLPTVCSDANLDGFTDPGSECNFDWWRTDLEIRKLENLGYNIYLRIAFPPTWTTGATYPNETLFYCYVAPVDPNGPADPRDLDRDTIRDDANNCNNPDRRPGYRAAYTPNHYPAGYDRTRDFRLFVEGAVRRYKHAVKAWGFGTEVHNLAFWQGTTAQFFDEILRPGYEVVKAVDPSLTVVGPDEDWLPDFGPSPLEQLVELETTRGKRAFDVISHHVLHHSGWTDPCDVTRRLKPIIDRVRKGRPFWLTELGRYSGNSAEHQLSANWLEDMTTSLSGQRVPACASSPDQTAWTAWVDKIFVYRIKDGPGNARDMGLLDTADNPKPAYTRMQQFLATQSEPRFYYLAEGATRGFFDLDIAIANPNSDYAPARVSFMKPDGSIVLQMPTLAPKSRITIRANDVAGLENTDVSTVVESTTGVPLAVERTMFWDRATNYGGHTDAAVTAPSTTWYFAEGSQGFFDTYLLLANSGIVTANVNVTFLLQGGDPVTKQFAVGPTSRKSVCSCQFAELSQRSFGIVVESDRPIIAERAMYFGKNPFWTAGHESAGVPAPSTSWFLAEGHTGPFFDEWVLIGNPNDQPAQVDVSFVTSNGDTVSHLIGPNGDGVLPAKQRVSVHVDEVPGLEYIAVATKVTADVPVIVERAMYWPGTPGQWYEAHNSFGVTTAGTRWALAEGRRGTGRKFETYILLYNTSDTDATVDITFLPRGAAAFTRSWTVNAHSRFDVDARSDIRLANLEFGALIESDQPIVVERAMYWSGGSCPGGCWGWGGTNATAARIQ